MLEANETYGLTNRTVYKDYCPMAFGDEGAYWLSEKKRNFKPLFRIVHANLRRGKSNLQELKPLDYSTNEIYASSIQSFAFLPTQLWPIKSTVCLA